MGQVLMPCITKTDTTGSTPTPGTSLRSSAPLRSYGWQANPRTQDRCQKTLALAASSSAREARGVFFRQPEFL